MDATFIKVFQGYKISQTFLTEIPATAMNETFETLTGNTEMSQSS